jgi:hypothetical protein
MRFEAPGAVNIKIAVFWNETLCCLVACTDVSEDPAASIIRAFINSNTSENFYQTTYQNKETF